MPGQVNAVEEVDDDDVGEGLDPSYLHKYSSSMRESPFEYFTTEGIEPLSYSIGVGNHSGSGGSGGSGYGALLLSSFRDVNIQNESRGAMLLFPTEKNTS